MTIEKRNRRARRQDMLRRAARILGRTVWGYYARPGQLKAGARVLVDRVGGYR